MSAHASCRAGSSGVVAGVFDDGFSVSPRTASRRLAPRGTSSGEVIDEAPRDKYEVLACVAGPAEDDAASRCGSRSLPGPVVDVAVAVPSPQPGGDYLFESAGCDVS